MEMIKIESRKKLTDADLNMLTLLHAIM